MPLNAMEKVKSDSEILSDAIRIERKTILDIGCGTGNLVRWMSSQGGECCRLGYT